MIATARASITQAERSDEARRTDKNARTLSVALADLRNGGAGEHLDQIQALALKHGRLSLAIERGRVVTAERK